MPRPTVSIPAVMTSLEGFFSKTATIVSGFVLIGGAVAYLGFSFNTPSDAIEKLSTKIDKLQVSHDEEAELVKMLARSTCLEHPKIELEQLGLMAVCRNLGIER